MKGRQRHGVAPALSARSYSKFPANSLQSLSLWGIGKFCREWTGRVRLRLDNFLEQGNSYRIPSANTTTEVLAKLPLKNNVGIGT